MASVVKPVFSMLVAVLVLLSPIAVVGVNANGDSVEIFRERSGAYEVVLGVLPERPAVGTVHLTVTPIDAQTSAPVVDARITIVAHDPEGEPAYQVRALNSPAARMYYDANLTLPRPGLWTLKLDVQSDALGTTTVDVPLQVDRQSIPPSLGGTVIWFVVLGVLVGGAGYVWYRSKGAGEGVKGEG